MHDSFTILFFFDSYVVQQTLQGTYGFAIQVWVKMRGVIWSGMIFIVLWIFSFPTYRGIRTAVELQICRFLTAILGSIILLVRHSLLESPWLGDRDCILIISLHLALLNLLHFYFD